MSAQTTHLVMGSTRNILLGGGLAYSVEQRKYHHIPIIFFVPSIYAGYQAFSNRDPIAAWVRENFTKTD
jgi:hypothetical protein